MVGDVCSGIFELLIRKIGPKGDEGSKGGIGWVRLTVVFVDVRGGVLVVLSDVWCKAVFVGVVVSGLDVEEMKKGCR